VTVKAAIFRRYGSPSDVVRIEEVDDPVPGDGEVLIAVRAASVNPMDAHLMKGKPALARLAFGLRRPKRTRSGVDMAGLVEAVGPGVTRFKPGDAVFGSCRGAIAERACATESCLALKPANISFTQAAAAPVAGVTALQGLRDKARLRAGQSILINGAAGGVGTFAVQIAKAFGAHVTAVCSTGISSSSAPSAPIASSITPGKISPPGPSVTTSSSTSSATIPSPIGAAS
jgi:NADPH:quinone reductase-like Zn-dependent oxidoreductase